MGVHTAEGGVAEIAASEKSSDAVKKGRGRPRKYPIGETNGSSSENVKRRRGRPPKQKDWMGLPCKQPVDDTAHHKSGKIKRGRGRPPRPKIQGEEKEDIHQIIRARIATLPNVATPHKSEELLSAQQDVRNNLCYEDSENDITH